MALNFHQLRCFDAVARHSSFTAAAKALFVGQPSVTTHIKGLESRFGTELLMRRGQTVQLTAAGSRLFEVTRHIFELEAKAEELLRESGGQVKGELRIAAFNPSHAAQMAAAFSKSYPNVEVTVLLSNTEEMVNSLLSMNADVATLPRLEDPRFHRLEYGAANIVLLVPRGHRWASRESVRLRELEGERMIMREAGSMHQRIFLESLARSGVSVKTSLQTDSQEAVREAVAAEMGLAIELDAHSLCDERLTKLALPEVGPFPNLEVACLVERRDSPLIRAFFHSVEQSLTPQRANAASGASPAVARRGATSVEAACL